MKKFYNIFVFIVTIYSISILNLFNSNAAEISKEENRKLQGVPVLTKETYFSGEFFRDFDAYISDHFAFRGIFLELNERIKSLRGIAIGQKVELVQYTGVNVAEAMKTIEENAEKEENEKFEFYENFGQILIVGDKAMEVNFLNEEASLSYANAINNYAEKLKDTKVYSMLIPTQIEFVEYNEYKDVTYSQRESIDLVKNNLSEKAQFIDVYDTLKAHGDEYIYFRTDHHWTGLGAYYAFQKFAEDTGQIAPEISTYEKITIDNFLGTLYNASRSDELKNNPDEIVAYKSQIPHKYVTYYRYTEEDTGIELDGLINEKYCEKGTKYSMFLCGDYALSKITSDCSSDKKILILKDSYANAFTPYLIDLYKEIYIIDPRLFEGNIAEIVENEKIDEVLFLNYALINRYRGYDEMYNKLIN